MNIPQNLPITPLQSKAARYQLGLTQANVIQESDLPGHKLKGFETGRFIPDMKFLDALRTYFEVKGVDLSTLKEGDGLMPVTAAAVKPGPGAALVKQVHRMCFYVSDQIPEDQVEALLGRMDANDERIATILPQSVSSGLFSTFDEQTEQKQRELFGAMAENYLLFRLLQGRNILSPPQSAFSAHSHADVLSSFFASSPLAGMLKTPVAAGAPLTADEETAVEE